MFPEAISLTDGPVWAMTDLASARALGLTPVALRVGGGFVAPTAATMDAAVALMKPDAHGLLVPDPAASRRPTPAAGATAPYPLTYVVYTLVPAQPLYDTEHLHAAHDVAGCCSPAGCSYVTGTGQTNLPAGMEPLPPALAAQAQGRHREGRCGAGDRHVAQGHP